ncbi:hypothetical protein VIBC2010_05639, partial [Vibrio caribbeanicus ATCC BAA-2122]
SHSIDSTESVKHFFEFYFKTFALKTRLLWILLIYVLSFTNSHILAAVDYREYIYESKLFLLIKWKKASLD